MNDLPDDRIEELRQDFEEQWLNPFPQDHMPTVRVDSNCDGNPDSGTNQFEIGGVGMIEPRRSVLCKFLESHRIQMPFPFRLVAGLVIDDTQLCWFRWVDWVVQNYNCMSSSRVLEYFHSLPRLEMVFDLLGDKATNEDLWRTTVQNEFEIRQRYGDAPSAEWFRTKYGITVEPLRDLTPRQVSLNRHVVPLEGKFEFGRRRINEPVVKPRVETEEGSRFFIADASDNRFSRKQMWVMRLSNDIGAIGQLAERVSPSPKASIELVRFPFRVEIEDVQVNFY